MNTRSSWLCGIAVAALSMSFIAVAQETSPLASDLLLTPQQELSAELSAGSRDSLDSVTPLIALPPIEVQPPAPILIGS